MASEILSFFIKQAGGAVLQHIGFSGFANSPGADFQHITVTSGIPKNPGIVVKPVQPDGHVKVGFVIPVGEGADAKGTENHWLVLDTTEHEGETGPCLGVTTNEAAASSFKFVNRDVKDVKPGGGDFFSLLVGESAVTKIEEHPYLQVLPYDVKNEAQIFNTTLPKV